jgi:CBS domain-containing protein
MFDYDVLEPGILVEPEALISRGKDIRRVAFLTPIHALPMRRPLLLSRTSTVAEAARLMIDEDARAAFIVGSAGVIALVTETDIFKLLRNPFADLACMPALKAIARAPAVCLDTDSIAVALRSFKAHAASHLSVIKADGAPHGILDALAITDWMSNQLSVIVFDKLVRD